jgi:hypothetical protein
VSSYAESTKGDCVGLILLSNQRDIRFSETWKTYLTQTTTLSLLPELEGLIIPDVDLTIASGLTLGTS